MPVNDYDPNSCFGRDPIVDKVIHTLFEELPRHRGLLVEGPARRGKSWVVCRIRDKLSDPAALAALVPGAPPVAVCLFTSESGYRGTTFDPLRLIAEIWWALHPFRPGLLWPQGLQPDASRQEALDALHTLFVQGGYEAGTLIGAVDEALAAPQAPVFLALLVDGLDEFEDLPVFERQILEPLMQSASVLVLGSRRSQVRGASWSTLYLRNLTQEQVIDIVRLEPQAASLQINRYFGDKESRLSFDDLSPLFAHYVWQNPGANKQFADDAIRNDARHARTSLPLVTRDNIRDCVLMLSTSTRHGLPISDADYRWLVEVVRTFPHISSLEVAVHMLNPVLSTAAGRSVGDRERNDWLGRLQERGIVALRKRASCLIHEEFAALCRE